MSSTMDKSNGYEEIASIFLKGRGLAVHGIGSSAVRNWAQKIQPGSVILDLGCGTGIPVSKILIEEGMRVYGIDASPTLAKAFHQNFPDSLIVCEPAEDSSFFDRQFDAIIAWGLLFLMPEDAQIRLIRKVAMALKAGGRFLFTAPDKPITWNDIMTGLGSRSLGEKKYKEIMTFAGLSVLEEFEDEGENHYYHSLKK
jgi:SAM-dependent methyltransferase